MPSSGVMLLHVASHMRGSFPLPIHAKVSPHPPKRMGTLKYTADKEYLSLNLYCVYIDRVP